ncbi:hypothetical protein WJX72_001106 [[Myrmecia] bisecta]|uniref:Alpha 1,4-glycosyltransferase domain-containing protein n=1 Tax=[Myrmecia] bisecta TaxID=41462 RepID=A0AAW1PAK8_9CHLO
MTAVDRKHPGDSLKVQHNVFFIMAHQDIMTKPAYLCGLESAARLALQSNYRVTLFATDPTRIYNEWPLAAPLINICKVELEGVYASTPLEDWFQSGAYRNSTWVDQNLSNALRLALVYKYGGTYLDLDTITMSGEIFSERNTMGEVFEPEENGINNHFFSFEQHHPLVHRLMEAFVQRFDGYTWAHNGPKLFKSVYDRLCKASNDAACRGVVIVPRHRHTPYDVYTGPQALCTDWMINDAWERLMAESWLVHWSNSVFHKDLVLNGQEVFNVECYPPRSLLVKIMVHHCPVMNARLIPEFCDPNDPRFGPDAQDLITPPLTRVTAGVSGIAGPTPTRGKFKF